VGNQLVKLGVRTPEKLVFRGWGAEHPVAPNDTEANKQRNRRVEITILEN
jgi:outer membrane protein OmpA-like peptidoglycan-associated protein